MGEDYYQCLFCGQDFMTRKYYKEHLASHRTAEEVFTSLSINPKTPTSLECPLEGCKVTLLTRKTLWKHIQKVHWDML